VDREVVIEVRTLGLTRRKATIRTSEGSWTVTPERALARHRTIANADGTIAARYEPAWLRAGSIHLADGASYRINTAWFAGSAELVGTMGSKVVVIRWRWPSLRNVATVSVEPAGTAERRLGLLTAVAFLELLHRRRAAAASGGG
jgi:hypothetical protein